MSLHLEVRVPEGLALEIDVSSVRAQDPSGSFGLRPGHERFLTVLAPGIVAYRGVDGHEAYVAVDGGVLLLEHDRIRVATREAVLSDRLDTVADAVAAILAQRAAEERSAGVAAEELAAALLRQFRQAEERR